MYIKTLWSIFIFLVVPVVTSCKTMSYEEKFRHDYLIGPSTTNWPYFKSGSEVWVGAITKRDKLFKKVNGNLNGQIFPDVPSQYLTPLNVERVGDKSQLVVEIKFSNQQTRATYWAARKRNSPKIRCEVILTNKTFHADNTYIELSLIHISEPTRPY